MRSVLASAAAAFDIGIKTVLEKRFRDYSIKCPQLMLQSV